jgi:hypothetical protein
MTYDNWKTTEPVDDFEDEIDVAIWIAENNPLVDSNATEFTGRWYDAEMVVDDDISF